MDAWRASVGRLLLEPDRVYFFTVEGVTEVYSAQGQPKKLATNMLDDMERTYGVAVVDNGFVLRSGRRVMRVAQPTQVN